MIGRIASTHLRDAFGSRHVRRQQIAVVPLLQIERERVDHRKWPQTDA